jgi:hypothetical protein
MGSDVKIIVILRNPVDMMFSLWRHCARYGIETRPAERALLSSHLDDPLAPGNWRTMYARHAYYALSLRRYVELFPAEMMKVYLFEEFFSEGLPLYPDLCRFLGIADDHVPDALVYNKGQAVRSRHLVRFMNFHYERYVFPVIRYVTPHWFRKMVKDFLVSANKSQADEHLPDGLRSVLQERLAPTVRELEEMLGRDLSIVWF